jgi:aldehyde dehydrogenase (NAD+)
MLEVRDPADVRSVVAEVPAMTAAEVAAAYARARAAFTAGRRVNPLDRAAVLARAAALIRARIEDGAVILVRENGKTRQEARVEVTKTAGWDVHHPFGGFRESGSAFKEQGTPGLRFYTRIKTAAVRYAW